MAKPNKYGIRRASYNQTIKAIDIMLKVVAVALNKELGVGKVRLERLNKIFNEEFNTLLANAHDDEEYAMHKLNQEYDRIMT